MHGSYPPLRQRIDLSLGESEADRAVTDLQQRVEVTGQEDRANFAPRITIRTLSGNKYHDELTGNELK